MVEAEFHSSVAAEAGASPPDAAAPPAPFFRRSHLYALTFLASLYWFTSALAVPYFVQLPLGLLTLFIVPGYAIGWLALGRHNRWPWSITFALVVAWSVAVNVAIGIVLLVLHLGLPPLILGGCAFALIGAAMVIESFRVPPARVVAAPSPLRAGLSLSGYRPAQRATAFGLFVAIVLVLVAIIYFASVFPPSNPGLAFSITGYGGTSANLPTSGAVNQTLVLEAIVQNNATAQTFNLELLSFTQGSNPPTYHTIPWATVLVLGNATASTLPLAVASSSTQTVVVVFKFLEPGEFVLQFLLETPTGSVLANTTWTVNIV